MMIIMKNPDWSDEQHISFAQKVADNEGYCTCMLLKTNEPRCMCKEFRDMVKYGKEGTCHCGRFISKYEREDKYCI